MGFRHEQLDVNRAAIEYGAEKIDTDSDTDSEGRVKGTAKKRMQRHSGRAGHWDKL